VVLINIITTKLKIPIHLRPIILLCRNLKIYIIYFYNIVSNYYILNFYNTQLQKKLNISRDV